MIYQDKACLAPVVQTWSLSPRKMFHHPPHHGSVMLESEAPIIKCSAPTQAYLTDHNSEYFTATCSVIRKGVQ